MKEGDSVAVLEGGILLRLRLHVQKLEQSAQDISGLKLMAESYVHELIVQSFEY